MPLILKFLTFHAILAILAILALGATIPLPYGSFNIDGKIVTYIEFWSSGAGFICLLIGIGFPISGYLFLKKHQFSRQFYLTIWFALIILQAVMQYFDNKNSVDTFLVGFILTLLIGVYLFWSKSVQIYFSSGSSDRN
jgi:hypothetical protein